MKSSFRALVVVGLATLSSAMAVVAQDHPRTRLKGLYISALSGGAAHSDLQRSDARAEWVETGGLEQRDFSRRLSPATALAVGGAAGYWVTPWWGVRLQGTLIPSRFEVSVSQREKAQLPEDSLLMGSDRFSDLRIWTADLQFTFRAPFTPRGRVAPYGFLGAGMVRYDALNNQPLPPEAESSFSGRPPTKASAVFGIGALVPLQRRGLALSFELSDHVVRTPVEEAAGSAADASGVRLFTHQSAEADGAARVRLTSHIQLLIGVTLFQR